MTFNRVFLIVMDSFGCGEAPDAKEFHDEGSNTLKSCYFSPKFKAPNLTKLGLFNIDGVDFGDRQKKTLGSYARLQEKSADKDTTTGHWEMSGLISNSKMPKFPNGFPKELMDKMVEAWGRGYLVNKPYSGTEVLLDYGQEHVDTGKLIVYTSADSVFQIAGHEDIIPLEDIYMYCKQARNLLTGEFAVGRVIARPFKGAYPNFERTPNRHDYSLKPHGKTMLDALQENGKRVISVGKIYDIFASCGIDESFPSKDNQNGMEITLDILRNKDFTGLCFVNLVDFDSKFGHRNNVDGYAEAVTKFDKQLGKFMKKMKKDDLLIITADHGCDPKTESTDHSREFVPMLAYSKNLTANVNLGTILGFDSIAKTILDNFEIQDEHFKGQSFYSKIIK